MSYAIIRTGGKQFAVESGQKIRIPSIDKKEGETVELEALSSGDGADMSFGAGATLNATVLGHGRGDKVIVFKRNAANNTNANKVIGKVIRKLKLIRRKNSKSQIPNSK